MIGSWKGSFQTDKHDRRRALALAGFRPPEVGPPRWRRVDQGRGLARCARSAAARRAHPRTHQGTLHAYATAPRARIFFHHYPCVFQLEPRPAHLRSSDRALARRAGEASPCPDRAIVWRVPRPATVRCSRVAGATLRPFTYTHCGRPTRS